MWVDFDEVWLLFVVFFFSRRRRHTRWTGDWSSDVCSSDLLSDDEARPTARRRLIIGPGQHPIEESDMRYARISADSHIDMPWMPNDLFTLNASVALKDRMPYVADGPDGPYWTCKNGMSFGLVCGVGPGGAKYVPGQNYRVEKMHAAGLYDDAKAGKRRVIDPHLRVKDQDLDGVDAEVLFGILGAATRLNDHEAAKEMFRIYNDWLVDFCKPYPGRLLGLACLPYGDIKAAIEETYRVAKRGGIAGDRKSTRLNSSHPSISYAVFCLKK